MLHGMTGAQRIEANRRYQTVSGNRARWVAIPRNVVADGCRPPCGERVQACNLPTIERLPDQEVVPLLACTRYVVCPVQHKIVFPVPAGRSVLCSAWNIGRPSVASEAAEAKIEHFRPSPGAGERQALIETTLKLRLQ